MAFLYLYIMKFLTLGLLFFLTTTGFSQDRPLSNDDRGKLIFYEVVESKDVSKGSLNDRVTAFFKKTGKSLKVQSAEADSVTVASGKFVIHKTALVMSRPSGEVL